VLNWIWEWIGAPLLAGFLVSGVWATLHLFTAWLEKDELFIELTRTWWGFLLFIWLVGIGVMLLPELLTNF